MDGEENLTEQGGQKVYELGFYFVPTLSEEEALEKSQKIREFVVSHGVEEIHFEAPVLRNLAYQIEKHTAGKNEMFSRAYFSWIKFVMTASSVLDLKKEMENDKDVLRFLIIKTTRENTFTPSRPQSSPVESGETDISSDELPEVVEEEAVVVKEE